MATTNASTEIMSANLTKRGFVSLWESGGGATNTGDACIICKADGSKPTATYIRRSGQLSNAEHALIPIHPGYYMIRSYHHRGDFDHQIYKIIQTFTEGEGEKARGKVEIVLVNQYDRGEWDKPLDKQLEAAVAAAEKKATCYHCRHAVFVTEKEKKEN